MSAGELTRDTGAEADYAWSAAVYDFVLEPVLRHIRARFAGWMSEQEIERALDIGCGTGRQIALTPEGTEAIGIDLSRPMLRQAQRKVPGRCIHGDATALPFEDGSFDLVYTQFALHEKPPAVIAALLDEARRVLRTDGRLAVVDYAIPHAGWRSRFSQLGITSIERLAGGEHFTNYRAWMTAGGIDSVVTDAGWSEIDAYRFYNGTIKMAIYRPL